MKLIICGHGRHGKDAVAEYLTENHEFKFSNTSMFLVKLFLFDALKEKYKYSNEFECYIDRHNHREEWFNLITEYTSKDSTRIATEIFKKEDLFVGVRNKREFEASKHLATATIWVDRSKYLPAEDISSNEITEEMCDLTIDNNGSLEELYLNIERLLMKLDMLNIIHRIEDSLWKFEIKDTSESLYDLTLLKNYVYQKIE